MDALPCADNGGILVVVIGLNSSGTAQQLNPLIVAISSLTAVADRPDHSISKLEQHYSAIHVARFPYFRVIENASLDKNLFHLATDQETCHIKIMDGHIQEDTARTLDISDRWWLRIATDDVQHARLTDLSLLYCLAHAGIVGIK